MVPLRLVIFKTALFCLLLEEKLFRRVAERLEEVKVFGNGGSFNEFLLVLVWGTLVVVPAAPCGSAGATSGAATDMLTDSSVAVFFSSGDSVTFRPKSSSELNGAANPIDEILARRELRRLLVFGVSLLSSKNMLPSTSAGDNDSRFNAGDSLLPRADILARRRAPRFRCFVH